LITESDPGGLNNVNLSSYDSLADLKILNASSTTFLPGPSPAVSISGLAYDGFQFHLITESDPGGLNNVNLSSYDSLADLKILNASSTTSLPGPSPAVSISALVFVPDQASQVPEPGTIWLLAAGGIVLLMMNAQRRRFQKYKGPAH
jgi:hypothetical protein